MKKSVLFFLLLVLPATASATDLTVTYKLEGGDAKEKTVYWTDQYQLVAFKGGEDQLVDLAKNTVYTIDHAKKRITYFKMDDMANMMGGMAPMMEQAMGMQMPGGKGTMGENLKKNLNKALGDPDSAPLQRLGSLQIAGRTCDNYRVERKGKSMELVEEVCIDPTLKPPGGSSGADKLSAMADGMMSGPLAGIQSSGEKELQAIQGTTLKKQMKTGAKMGIFGKRKQATGEEAILVKEGPVDPSLFKLPEGYQMVNQADEFQREMQEAQEKFDGMMKSK